MEVSADAVFAPRLVIKNARMPAWCNLSMRKLRARSAYVMRAPAAMPTHPAAKGSGLEGNSPHVYVKHVCAAFCMCARHACNGPRLSTSEGRCQKTTSASRCSYAAVATAIAVGSSNSSIVVIHINAQIAQRHSDCGTLCLGPRRVRASLGGYDCGGGVVGGGGEYSSSSSIVIIVV
jgi:hypothetical protein